jgi:hypothetical protein
MLLPNAHAVALLFKVAVQSELPRPLRTSVLEMRAVRVHLRVALRRRTLSTALSALAALALFYFQLLDDVPASP